MKKSIFPYRVAWVATIAVIFCMIISGIAFGNTAYAEETQPLERFYGFSFYDTEFMYDGKAHNAQVDYDKEKWPNVQITYSVVNAVEVGRYPCTATVRQQGYEDLVLYANLIIKSTVLVSNKLADEVILERETGFDPNWTVSVVENDSKELAEEAKTCIDEKATKPEGVLGIYDIRIFDGTSAVRLDDAVTVRLKLEKVTSADNVRIYLYSYGSYVETEYEFTDGYFIFTSKNVEGIAVIGVGATAGNKTSDTLIGIIFGVAVLLVIAIVIEGLNSKRKNRRYWRKKHSKWA